MNRSMFFKVGIVQSILRFCCLLLFLLAYSQNGWAENNRIVGYLPYYRFHLVDQMELHKLTHLVIAFGHPNAQGRVELPRVDIWPVARKAKAAGVKVLLSLGGGALYPEDEKYWKYYLQPGQRSVFIRNIIQYLHDYDLDGIDVDLEWKHIDQHYSGFVLELEKALRPQGLLLTAALPATTRYENLTDEALMAFDFVNLMVYDLTGPFNPGRPGQHSPFSFAVNSIDFWRRQGLSPDRMTLGLPMFGWNFSVEDTVSSITYRDLVAMDNSFALLDQVGLIYYNGLSMIRAKAELARSEVSGVMLWELGQDAFNELSLLRAVHEVMYPTLEPASVADLKPEDIITPAHPPVLGNDGHAEDIFDLKPHNGRLTFFRSRGDQTLMALPVPNYPPAFYFSASWAYELLRRR